MKHRCLPALFVTLALMAPLVGCSDSGDNKPTGDAKTTDDAKTKKKETPDKPMAIALTTLKTEEIVKAVKDQQGKIVVLDTWATWCIPCKKEFPELVKLHKEHGKDGVACMSVTIDGADEATAALEFLKKVGAAFPNYRVDSDTAWLDKWNIEGIPVVLVFQNGELVKKFENDPNNQFTYEDVSQLVEELLKKNSS